MTDEQKRTIWVVAKWLTESLSAIELNRLDDYLTDRAVHTDYDIADELRRALGYPSGE